MRAYFFPWAVIREHGLCRDIIQVMLKIIGRLSFMCRLPLSIVILIVIGSALGAQPGGTPGVSPERLALLARGINLNAWFTPWADPDTYDIRFRADEAAFLKRAGFTVCRLPLAPDLLFDESDPSHPKPVVRYVDNAIRTLLDAGLAVVLDPIHGSSSNADWEEQLNDSPAFLSAAEVYWESLARRYSAMSSDRIFFEVMNEPHLTAKRKVDASWWQPVQARLVQAIRRGAPDSTIIATGEGWGGIDGLLALQPLSDGNVVYSFHCYDPFVFTHQGASWTSPVQAELAAIPYPSSPDAVEAIAGSLSDPAAAGAVRRYGRESWNEDRLRSDLARAADWGKQHNVPVFCGEFGVYRKVSPQADRLRWIHDMRESLESLGIGWSMWDYETDFGLITYAEPSWRRGIVVDSGCLESLGLDAKAVLPPRPGESTVADFAAGRTSEITIPAWAWAKLWTREAGAGEESVEESNSLSPDGKGIVMEHHGEKDWSIGSALRFPVVVGETLELSAPASCTGEGKLFIGFVARDSSGTVLDWSLGATEIVAGTAARVVASATAKEGMATLEPRWFGSGKIKASLGAMSLRRVAAASTSAVKSEPISSADPH